MARLRSEEKDSNAAVDTAERTCEGVSKGVCKGVLESRESV